MTGVRRRGARGGGAQNPEHVRVGLIAKTHGIKGELCVKPLTDDINRFRNLTDVYVERGGRARRAEGAGEASAGVSSGNATGAGAPFGNAVGAGASSGNAAPARPAAVAPAGSPPQAGQPGAAGEDALRVEFARFHRGQVFLKFYGYDDADSASALKGRYIAVARDQLVKLEEGAYFVFDLIGCAVRGLDGERLGILADVLETGSNDVYVVERPDGGDDLLVPALKSVVKSVCIDDKTIIVDKSLFAQP